jgi:carbon monoxide dehydrogenase subunit G
MQIENAFDVKAPPERVYNFLLDVNQVVACMPGAELVGQVDPQTFKGKVKIKVGPVTVAYDGLARIAERDDAKRTAILEAEGRETTAPGSARSRSEMAVVANNGGSTVHISTEFSVAGRTAQFGRGLMEDVSKRLVAQMADGIRDRLEAAAPEANGGIAAATVQERPAAKPVNAIGLLFSILAERIRNWFRR